MFREKDIEYKKITSLYSKFTDLLTFFLKKRYFRKKKKGSKYMQHDKEEIG